MVRLILEFLGALFVAQLIVNDTRALLWGLLIACVIMIVGTIMVQSH